METLGSTQHCFMKTFEGSVFSGQVVVFCLWNFLVCEKLWLFYDFFFNSLAFWAAGFWEVAFFSVIFFSYLTVCHVNFFRLCVLLFYKRDTQLQYNQLIGLWEQSVRAAQWYHVSASQWEGCRITSWPFWVQFACPLCGGVFSPGTLVSSYKPVKL